MKKVCNCYYVHKSNWKELYNSIEDKELRSKANLVFQWSEKFIEFTVVKFDKSKNTLSFIFSPDWDTAYEPVVDGTRIFYLNTGDCVSNMETKYLKGRNKNKQIYHSKELFVSDDYTGFDIEAAKRRTAEWNKLPNINKSKIGNQDFWIAFLKENNMEA